MNPRYGVQWGGDIPCSCYSEGGLFNGYYVDNRLVWDNKADAQAYRDSRATDIEPGETDDYEVVAL